MPIRNCEKTVRLAIQSLINQTYTNWELLLIDDGSTDDTVSIACTFNDPRIRLLRDDQSLGLPRRLNEAIGLTRGDYFARMDGDDVSYPKRLETQLGHLIEKDLDLVGAGMVVFGRGGQLLGKRAAPETHAAICSRPTSGFAVAHPTFLGKASFFRRYMYRVSAVRCEDQDLLLRSYRESRFGNVSCILLGYREERLDLAKLLTSRLFFAVSLWREFRLRGQPFTAARAAAGQGLRATVDTIAISTRLDHRLLRHRALPASISELEEWKQVWSQLSTNPTQTRSA